MKTTAFGISGLAIVFVTIIAVVQLVTGHTRTTNLQNHLQQALESSLKIAMDGDKAYAINDDDELVADVLEGLAVRLDDNCDLRVEVNAIDRTKGILSVKVTAYYMTKNGDTNSDGKIDENDALEMEPIDWNADGVIDQKDDVNGDGKLDHKDALVSAVTAERTIILEQHDVAAIGKHTVLYKIIDNNGQEAMYKKYTLTDDTAVMCPINPKVNFDGKWYIKEGGAWKSYTRDQIKGMTLTKDMTFYNKQK